MNEKKMTVNPMWVLFLGACPALGATGTLKGAVAMGVTVLAVMLLTALVMALLRRILPERAIIAATILTAALFTSAAQLVLHAVLPSVYKMLGVYLAAAAVNLLVFSRSADNAAPLCVGKAVATGLEFLAVIAVVALLRELFGSIDWIELDRGTISEAEIIERCTARVGEPLRGAVEKLVGRWDRPELPVEGMKALTDELYEKGYGLYLLTNAGPRHREYWPRFAAAEHFPEERVYRSADVHLLKPDPAFYEGALGKFGLDRTECVFIDDSAANAESARRVGLDAIVFFGDAVRLRGELRARGVNVGE